MTYDATQVAFFTCFFMRLAMTYEGGNDVTNDYLHLLLPKSMTTKHGGCTYIITNKNNTVLYTGVTAELRGRIREHKSKFFEKSFSARYNCDKIVWYEVFDTIMEAIDREKQIKAGSRKKKIALIEHFNPEWKDLWEEIQDL